MRVLHLTWGSIESYGGIETHIVHLSRGLGACGIECETMTLPSMNWYHLRHAGGRPRLPLLHFPEILERLIVDQAFDIVHTHNIHRPFAHGIAQAVASIAAFAGVPHVATIHDVGGQPQSVALSQSISKLLTSAQCIVTSEYNRRVLTATYQITAAAVIPPAFDFTTLSLTEEPEPRTIAYPGRLTPAKGALEAVILVGQLANSYDPLTLLLSDPSQGSYGQTEEYIQLLKDVARTFQRLSLQFLPQGCTPQEFYSRAALTLCLPLTEEGFGLVPLESLAAGRPVVATPTGGMSWVEGIPGIVAVPDRNVISLATAIVEIPSHWRDWHTKACNSHPQLQERFDARVAANQHIEVYESARARLEP
jgi:glycosyltransferase involved in cell wall biosynthesis